MGGDEVIMMPGSQMMIHDASMLEDGNEADHAKASTFLGRQSENIAGMYQRRGGGEAADWRELMLAETWAFADEAVELGLADRTEHDRGELLPVQERMTRAFDLSRYRYEGRSAAPAPAPRGANAQRRPAQTRSEDRMSPALTRPRLSSDAELRHAALERAAAATARPGHLSVARRTAPSGVSSARTAAFAATLTAKLVEWNGQKRYHLMGHASVVEVEYDMWDDFGPYKEVVDRAGFSKTLANEPDVAYLVNHRGITMARTTNGSLVLGMDDLGLATEAWLNPKRQDVTDLVTAVEDRDVTEMSFAFMLVDGTWSPDFSTFRIHEVDLDRGDVSAVTYGANPYTDVAARSREVLSDLDRLPAGAARAALARLERRTDITRLAASYERELAEKPEAHESRAEITPIAAGRSITHIEALLLED
jgi:HK97 family phage prohead protease